MVGASARRHPSTASAMGLESRRLGATPILPKYGESVADVKT